MWFRQIRFFGLRVCCLDDMRKEKGIILSSEAPFFASIYDSVTQRELYERHFKLMRVMSGKAVLRAGRQTIVVAAGDYAFVTPGGFSKIRMSPEGGKLFRLVGLNFTDKFLSDYQRRNAVAVRSTSGKLRCFEKLKSEPWLEALFLSLNYCLEAADLPDKELVEMKLCECMHILSERYPEEFSAFFVGTGRQRMDLETFLNENYMYNAPLVRFAELSGRSLSTFRRECQERFGMSPGEWIQRKRLERAYARLQAGERPSDIYWELGFVTLAHFSRKFRERYGFPPSQAAEKEKRDVPSDTSLAKK